MIQQCPLCEKTYERNGFLERHMNTHHPDTTLTNDTITNELDTEKTFMAEKAVNLDVIEFIGVICSPRN